MSVSMMATSHEIAQWLPIFMFLANDLGSPVNERMVADLDNRFTGIQVKAGVLKQQDVVANDEPGLLRLRDGHAAGDPQQLSALVDLTPKQHAEQDAVTVFRIVPEASFPSVRPAVWPQAHFLLHIDSFHSSGLHASRTA